MKTNIRKVLALVCSLALACAMVPATALSAFADDDTTSTAAFTIYAQDAATGETTVVEEYTEQELADITDNYPTLSYTYAKGVYSTNSYIKVENLLDDVDYWTDGSYVQFECSDGSYTKWTYTYEYATSTKYFFPNDYYDDSGNLVADSQSAYAVPDIIALNYEPTSITVGSKLLDLISVADASDCSIFFTGVDTDATYNAGRLMPQDVEGMTIVYQHEVTADDVTLSDTSYTYSGSACTPTVTVAAADGTELEQSVTTEETDDEGNVEYVTTDNYTVEYSNNTKAGTATVTVTMTNDSYTGTATKTFTIAKATNTLTAKSSASTKAKAKIVKYTKVKKAAQTVSAISKSGAKGTVTYTKASGSSKLTVNKSTGKITVKKGTKKGTYKIKVKVKAAGTANYKAATKTVTVYVKVS